MKIELSCSDDVKFRVSMDVYALTYETIEREFSMPLCVGDDWMQKIKCEMDVAPSRIHLQWDKAMIHFERKSDAEEFAGWLKVSESKAREGYATMRG